MSNSDRSEFTIKLVEIKVRSDGESEDHHISAGVEFNNGECFGASAKTILKNIEDHRLEELIYKDIAAYPNLPRAKLGNGLENRKSPIETCNPPPVYGIMPLSPWN